MENDGVSLRLPGILACPVGDVTMKSAFMSNLFHALKAGEEFICPVSSEATICRKAFILVRHIAI